MLSPRFRKKITQWEQSATILPVKWTPQENLHITIIPPWYENRSSAIRTLSANSLPISSFTLYFTDIGPGPTSHAPRLLWTTAEAAPQLTDLRSYLQNLLHISLEKRPYVPHITIGKLFTPTHAPTTLPPFSPKFTFTQHITHIHLVESFLYRSGAEYKILLSLPLL